MIEWLVKFLKVPSWSVTSMLREKNSVLEAKYGLLETKYKDLEIRHREFEARSDAQQKATEVKQKESDAENQMLKQENQQLRTELQRFSHLVLDKPKVDILTLMGKHGKLYIEQLQEALQLPETAVEYHLEQLAAHGYISAPGPFDDSDAYTLLHKGKDYLVKNNLL